LIFEVLLLTGGAGMDDGNSAFTSIKDALKDSMRIQYHNDYLTNPVASIK
jgi:beta-glucosidase